MLVPPIVHPQKDHHQHRGSVYTIGCLAFVMQEHTTPLKIPVTNSPNRRTNSVEGFVIASQSTLRVPKISVTLPCQHVLYLSSFYFAVPTLFLSLSFVPFKAKTRFWIPFREKGFSCCTMRLSLHFGTIAGPNHGPTTHPRYRRRRRPRKVKWNLCTKLFLAKVNLGVCGVVVVLVSVT